MKRHALQSRSDSIFHKQDFAGTDIQYYLI